MEFVDLATKAANLGYSRQSGADFDMSKSVEEWLLHTQNDTDNSVSATEEDIETDKLDSSTVEAANSPQKSAASALTTRFEDGSTLVADTCSACAESTNSSVSIATSSKKYEPQIPAVGSTAPLPDHKAKRNKGFVIEKNSEILPVKKERTQREDSEEIYIVQTSCLQCAIKNLPCNKAFPACSRCIRVGKGSDCLPQRDELPGEDRERGLWEDSIPLLLEVKGCGDSQSIEHSIRRRGLQEAFLHEYRLEANKKNWVLPRTDGPRKGFNNIDVRVKPSWHRHPGRGIGQGTLMKALEVADL